LTDNGKLCARCALAAETLALVDASIERAAWRDVGAVHPMPQWWYGYRQALHDLLYDDG
jgi:hypothetical protein